MHSHKYTHVRVVCNNFCVFIVIFFSSRKTEEKIVVCGTASNKITHNQDNIFSYLKSVQTP